MAVDKNKEAQKKVRKKAPPARAAATKRFLDIAEIRDGVVIMKDGTLRRVLLVSSINFFLKNPEEQEAIIAAYVQFLNSLESPIQIVVQARKLNIDGYMMQLKEQEEKQTSSLMKNQISEYRDFLKQLIDYGDIMDRRFFVVVPYDPLGKRTKGFWQRLSELMSPGKAMQLKEEQYEKRVYELQLLVDRVTAGLAQMGLEVSPLDTQTLIELYYQTYNPSVSANEKISDINAVQVES